MMQLSESIDAAAEDLDFDDMFAGFRNIKVDAVRRIGKRSLINSINNHAKQSGAIFADLQFISAGIKIDLRAIGQIAAVERQSLMGDVAESQSVRLLGQRAAGSANVYAEIS